MARWPDYLRGRASEFSLTKLVLAVGVLAVAFVGVSLSRPWWTSASWPGAIGATVTAAACVWLLHASLRLRALTLGAFTAVIVLAGFWAKWVAGSEPLKIYFIEVLFDNDLAIMVTGAFSLAFALGWVITHQVALRRSRALTSVDAPPASVSWMPPLWLLVVVGLALCALRITVAELWAVGVPGENPDGLEVPGLKTVIYYSCTYGPLACASLILLSRGSVPLLRWSSAGLVLLAYVTAGGYVGSRGATINAALVLLFVALAGPRTQALRLNSKQILAWVAATGAGVASLTLALALRPVGSSSSGPLGIFSFLEDRIGGLDFLSVAVSGVDRYGSSLGYLDTTSWVEFLTFTVYAYPPEAITGVASTLLGTAFGVGGWLAVALVGIVAGLLIGVADVKYARSADPAATTWYLGLLLAWVNLLLEGTLYPTLLIILSFGCVYGLLLTTGRWRGSARSGSAGDGTPKNSSHGPGDSDVSDEQHAVHGRQSDLGSQQRHGRADGAVAGHQHQGQPGQED